MHHLLRRRLWAVVIGVLAAAGSAAGIAYATGAIAGDSGGVVVGCAGKLLGELRIVSDPSKCTRLERVVYLQAPVAPQPTSFTVDCTAGQKVQDVLAQVAAETAPVTISVKGMCDEDVSINRDSVTLTAAATGSGVRSLVLIDARKIQLHGLAFGTGGLHADGSAFRADGIDVSGAQNGIVLNGGSIGWLTNATVENSTDTDIGVYNASTLEQFGGSLTGSGQHGLAVGSDSNAALTKVRIASNGGGVAAGDAGSADLANCTIEHNAGIGVQAYAGGTVDVRDGTVVQFNGNTGVMATAAEANILDAVISNNERYGVVAEGGRLLLSNGATVVNNIGEGVGLGNGSSLNSGPGGVTIRGNSSHGIDLGDTSTASIPDPVQIVGNGGWGIWCEPSPATAVIRGLNGVISTVSGNAAGQIGCQIVP